MSHTENENRVKAFCCITLLSCLVIITISIQSLDKIGNSDSPRCRPRSNIVFIKTHKCASSTIQNVFMRYGYFHNKIFVLPQEGNYLGNPEYFREDMVPSPDLFDGNYNILTHHSRMNYIEMRRLMPTDTVFISIIRNPVNLFESMFRYFELNRWWNIEFDLFNNEDAEIPNSVISDRYVGRIGINQMMFDLGFNEQYFYNDGKVKDYIQQLDSIFELVMVSERMDESLILLKDLLCWSYEDVVVFKLNARDISQKSVITETASKKNLKLNSADLLLYQHFSNKFDQRVKEFGEARMKKEVEILREKTHYYYRFCVGGTFIANSSSNLNFVGFYSKQKNNLRCTFLTESEINLTNYIRTVQIRNYPGSVDVSQEMSTVASNDDFAIKSNR